MTAMVLAASSIAIFHNPPFIFSRLFFVDKVRPIFDSIVLCKTIIVKRILHEGHHEKAFPPQGGDVQGIAGKRTFKEIERQIREMIYWGALKPGDKLPSEKELASQFRAGRLSVREALRTLEQAGLIVVKQGSTGGSYT